MESKGPGVLDAPLSRGMTAFCVKQRASRKQGRHARARPAYQQSSKIRRSARRSGINASRQYSHRATHLVIAAYVPAKIRLGPHMDRLTKATLWIAFLVLLSCFVLF
jgi:hypothetical protein